MKRSFILFTLFIVSLMLAAVPHQVQAQAQAQKKNQEKRAVSSSGSTASDQRPAQEEPKAPDDQKDVLRKIEDLQKQVDILKEQRRTREKLAQTSEEKAEQEKAVLTAVGREYYLMRKGQFELEYSLRYEYISSNVLVSATTVEPRANHTVRNAISVQYGVLNNVTTNIYVPFVYAYDKTGGSTGKDVSDLGDISLGIDFQPFKSGASWPTTIFTVGAVLPTGRSPYKINRDTDLPTGNGLYAFSLGMNMNKSVDPALAFGALSATYRLKRTDLNQNLSGQILERVEPAVTYSGALGLAYAISYALSMNTQFQYAYNTKTKYDFQNGTELVSPAYSTASLIIGAGWRVSPKTTLSFSIGIGLTKDDPDFFFLFRLPFDF